MSDAAELGRWQDFVDVVGVRLVASSKLPEGIGHEVEADARKRGTGDRSQSTTERVSRNGKVVVGVGRLLRLNGRDDS